MTTAYVDNTYDQLQLDWKQQHQLLQVILVDQNKILLLH